MFRCLGDKILFKFFIIDIKDFIMRFEGFVLLFLVYEWNIRLIYYIIEFLGFI